MRLKESSPHCEYCGFDERSKNNSHQLPAGTVVGNQYILGKVLGQGGFGITYLGWDRITEQTVAVKEFFPSGFAGRNTNTMSVTSYDGQDKNTFESNKKRFLREAEALGKLWNIPQIVKVLRCFEENGTVYIAMEYVDGMDLRKYLKRKGRPMNMEETLSILGPVIEALSYVHQAGLVHRDISPDNIMVLPDGSAKLLDFGAARYVENADAEKERATSTQAILKHGFAPPEQYQSHGALGPWTDVYAICATIYYCLTGKVPPEAMSQVIERRTIHWESVPCLTARQRTALEKGMSLTPKDRFPSAQELWDKLGAKKKKEVALPKPKEEKKTQKKSVIFLILAAVILAVSVGLVVLSTQKPSAEISAISESIPEATAEIMIPTTEAPTEPPLKIASLLEFENAALGETETIAVLSGHSEKDIQWFNDDTQVATVSYNGTVTAVGYGMAEITAQYQDQTVRCTIYVDRTPNVVCTYEENETGLTITGYEGTLPREAVIPRKINGIPVTRIGNNAFSSTGMTSVYIPHGIIEIGQGAFHDNRELTQVSIPQTVQSIEDSAFSWNLKLAQVSIPDSVSYIGASAFIRCPWPANQPEPFVICGDGILLSYNGSESHVEIPSSVKHIDNAFYENSTVTSVHIPDTVLSIGSTAFYQCSQLQSVTMEEGVTSIGQSAFSNCKSLTNIQIPDSVASIGQWAFFGCSSLKEIHIPEGMTSIEAHAFRTCTSLTSLHLPDSVTRIGEEAFLGCLSLSEVRIPDNVTFIGCNAFDYTPWLDQQTDRFVIVGDGVLIKYNHVPGRLVVVFSIPDTVKSISSAFQNISSIKMLTIPDTVTHIGDYAFSGCRDLINITLSKNASYIGQYAFRDCVSLSSISIPNGITSIERGTFDGCTALKTVTIPDSVTTICYRAFHSCGSIKGITIPASVATIEPQAFFGSYNLNKVALPKGCTTGDRSFNPGCVISYY